MKLPEEIQERILERTQTHSGKEMASVFQTIRQQYQDQQHKAGTVLVQSPKEVEAYVLSRMPATYGAVATAFEHVKKLIKTENYQSLLDIGAGTGAASLALAEQQPWKQITCWEREEAMIRMGKWIQQASKQVAIREVVWQQRDMTKLKQEPETSPVTADVVVLSYFINELTDEQRQVVLTEAWQRTKQLLLIVEPGTPTDYQHLLQAKDWFVAQGGYIVAPCTCQEGCPLPEEDWCHFVCRIERRKWQKEIKEASAPYEDEKFTYLAVAKEAITSEESNRNNLLQARILRHPTITQNVITLKLCQQGRIKERRVTKAEKEWFTKAKKAKAGDLWTENESPAIE